MKNETLQDAMLTAFPRAEALRGGPSAPASDGRGPLSYVVGSVRYVGQENEGTC